MVFPLVKEAVGLSLVLMATVYLAWHYCDASVRIENDKEL